MKKSPYPVFGTDEEKKQALTLSMFADNTEILKPEVFTPDFLGAPRYRDISQHDDLRGFKSNLSPQEQESRRTQERKLEDNLVTRGLSGADIAEHRRTRFLGRTIK